MSRETYIHAEMARAEIEAWHRESQKHARAEQAANLRAARDWDALAENPGAYHAAALTDLCVDRGLALSSGCDTPATPESKHEEVSK